MKLSIAPLRRSRMHLSGKPGPWDSRKDTGGEFAAFGCGELASFGCWRICSLRFAVNCVQRPRRNLSRSRTQLDGNPAASVLGLINSVIARILRRWIPDLSTRGRRCFLIHDQSLNSPPDGTPCKFSSFLTSAYKKQPLH